MFSRFFFAPGIIGSMGLGLCLVSSNGCSDNSVVPVIGEETTSASEDGGTLADESSTAREDTLVAADESGGADITQGSVAPYGKCFNSDECKDTLDKCVNGVEGGLWGQCIRHCTTNSDCPPPPNPATQQVGCSSDGNYCLIVCGVYQSVCPDYLYCYSMEKCLPKVGGSPTKKPGEQCKGDPECLGDSVCHQGSSGTHCTPKCVKDEDCAAAAPGFVGQCVDAGGQGVCIFKCSATQPCPGITKCQIVICI